MTLEQFRNKFPEFRATSEPDVQDALDQAAGGMSTSVYGSRFDEAHGYLAAHKLASSPMGMSARLEDDKTQTTYWREFARIRRDVSPRLLVT